MGGPRPRPTLVKKLEGELNRDRINEDAALPSPDLPDCPKHLSEAAKAEWHRVARELNRCGLLTELDGSAFAAYCDAYGKWVDAEKLITELGLLIYTDSGRIARNPAVDISKDAQERMRKFIVEFGMTPYARMRIRIEPAETDDEDDDLLT